MALFSKEEFKLFESLANLTQENTIEMMNTFLTSVYGEDKIIKTEDFIYALGDIPIALVAHMDTVFEPKEVVHNGVKYKTRRKVEAFYDQWKEMLASADGLGADDKAGIYAIIRILQETNLRPSIILTTDEEIGGVGATKFAELIQKPLVPTNYIIQLDRHGERDCVFYDLDSRDFERYIESFGFRTSIGSFSDISVICPAWGIAGVNLSVGYENEHTLNETLHVDWFLETVKKVKTMLSETDIPYWEYKEKPFTPMSFMYDFDDYYDDPYYSMGNSNNAPCDICGKEHNIFLLWPLIDGLGKTKHLCENCYDIAAICENCGDLFLKKKEAWHYCKDCAKEMRNKVGKRRNNSENE